MFENDLAYFKTKLKKTFNFNFKTFKDMETQTLMSLTAVGLFFILIFE